METDKLRNSLKKYVPYPYLDEAVIFFESQRQEARREFAGKILSEYAAFYKKEAESSVLPIGSKEVTVPRTIFHAIIDELISEAPKND